MKGKISLVLMVAILFLASCEKYLDVNTDPNNPATAETGNILPAAIMGGLYVIHGPYAILGGIWSQYWTQSNAANQYKTIDSYNVDSRTYQYGFSTIYSQSLTDIKRIKDAALTGEDWNSYLIATTLEAYFYQVLVDIYDDVPYTDALKGDEGITEPKYDKGEFIYGELLKNLDEALAKDFDASTNLPVGKSDLLFEGDIDGWKSFAQTVRLKLALHQYYAKTAESNTIFTDILSNGLITNVNNIGIDKQFEDVQYKGNPLWQENVKELNVATNLRASTTLLSFLLDNGDTRLPIYFDQGDGGNWVSLDQGAYNTPSTVIDPKTVAVFTATYNMPAYFFSQSEINFMLAEASILNGQTADVKAYYDDGVTSSFASYVDSNGDPLDASGFITGGAYEFDETGTPEEMQEAVIGQKWLALYGSHALQAWFDFNRTGYPKVSGVPASDGAYVPGQFTYSLEGSTGAGNFPKRLLFTQDERQRNSNTPATVPVETKVWWDKK